MLGILQERIANQGDGWRHAIEELARYYGRASERMFGPDPVVPESQSLLELSDQTPPLAALEVLGSYPYAAETLGRRTAELHCALAAATGNLDFDPEPLTSRDMQGLVAEMHAQADRALPLLAHNLGQVPAALAPQAQELAASGKHWLEHVAERLPRSPTALKTRIHGDYHLGQVLWASNDYIILDFEGEPTRSVEERRAKFSPIRDVAGMLRSYHYAAYAGLFSFTQDRPEDFPRLAPWAELWQQWVSAAFLAAYVQTAEGASFLPTEPRDFAFLLEGYMLAKALYELAYELNNRPDWVRIPLGGVLHLLGNRLSDESTAGEPHQ
jgi:maltose alpha-D-glucosyltransferase/alpha-amylase